MFEKKRPANYYTTLTEEGLAERRFADSWMTATAGSLWLANLLFCAPVLKAFHQNHDLALADCATLLAGYLAGICIGKTREHNERRRAINAQIETGQLKATARELNSRWELSYIPTRRVDTRKSPMPQADAVSFRI